MKPKQLAEKTIVQSMAIGFAVLVTSLCFSSYAAEDETNASTIYRRASSLLAQLPQDFPNRTSSVINNGWQVENEDLKELLTKNHEAIGEFKRATRLSYCQFTSGAPMKKDASTELPQHADEVNVARLVLLEGRQWEKENRPDLALENYLSVLRFANHLGQQKDFILLSKLLEIIVRRLAFAPLEQHINREQLTTQDCRHLLDSLVSLRRQDAGLEGAFEEEKEAAKNTIRTIKKKEWYNAFYNYEKMYNEFDRLEDEYLSYLVTAYRENKPEAYEERVRRFREQLEIDTKPFNMAWKGLQARLGLPEGIDYPTLTARQVFAIVAPRSTKVITRYYASLSEFDALITAAAVRLYELENGQIPDTLQAVVPTYLSKLPEDPFDDFKPLRYERREKRWIVYSIGPDREDNDGKLRYEEAGSDKVGDIVVSSL